MSLPRPQDQLKSYFDDLLYDENAPVVAPPKPQTLLATLPPIAEPEVEPVAAPADDYFVVKQTTEVSDQEAIYQLQRQRLQSLLNSLASPEEQPEPESLPGEPITDLSTLTLSAESEPLDSQWLDNGRPCWAQEPFDVLLVDVHGVQLAVPLAALGHIHKMGEAKNQLFGQAKWLLGIYKTLVGPIKSVDTAEFIMPERYQAEQTAQYRYIVVINGLQWGLAVNHIGQPTSIDPDTIRWRQRREQRPWIAGTVKEHLCVLLDIPVFGEVLGSYEKQA